MPDAAAPASVADLAGSEYVLLTTYTRDGTAKPTPVWAAPDGDALVVTTTEQTWKVRRVRNQPRVTLAACDMRGHPRGAPVDGVAVVVGAEHMPRVDRALRAKYGWKLGLTELLGRLGRSRATRVGIVVRDVPQQP